MIVAIKELINEILDKMQYLLVVLTAFCFFVSIFSIPSNILNHQYIKFWFPNSLLSNSNIDLILYFLSFHGFLWFLFCIMVAINHYFPLFCLNLIFLLKRVLEVIGSILMIAVEYGFIFINVRGVSLEAMVYKIEGVAHPFLFYIGLAVPVALLTLTIGSMIYIPSQE
ncbi:hypothetical protein [Enterococcus sp. DIV0756]|uniref:hypothetical protein n=1 Tax=Enterococcus sp. DIV0756 TaxID=2774636 RepID=UPI003F263B88